jgi:hypothetical protein
MRGVYSGSKVSVACMVSVGSKVSEAHGCTDLHPHSQGTPVNKHQQTLCRIS